MIPSIPPKVPEGGRFGQKASLNYGNPSAGSGQRLRDDLRKVSN
jgi:hypothetical protein